MYVKKKYKINPSKIYKQDQCFMAKSNITNPNTNVTFSLSCGRYDSLSQDDQITIVTTKINFKRKYLYQSVKKNTLYFILYFAYIFYIRLLWLFFISQKLR